MGVIAGVFLLAVMGGVGFYYAKSQGMIPAMGGAETDDASKQSGGEETKQDAEAAGGGGLMSYFGGQSEEEKKAAEEAAKKEEKKKKGFGFSMPKMPTQNEIQMKMMKAQMGM